MIHQQYSSSSWFDCTWYIKLKTFVYKTLKSLEWVYVFYGTLQIISRSSALFFVPDKEKTGLLPQTIVVRHKAKTQLQQKFSEVSEIQMATRLHGYVTYVARAGTIACITSPFLAHRHFLSDISKSWINLDIFSNMWMWMPDCFLHS